jgi:hypothetical protein
MEMASVLAGERWSDHPRCTHPLLAELARLVNDATDDHRRHELAVLIPSVVGLRSTDLRMDARIALRAATTALPVVWEGRRNALAVSVLVADTMLAVLERRAPGSLEPQSRAALDAVPVAAAWARDFVAEEGAETKGFRRLAAPHTVRLAVSGIVDGSAVDQDTVLRRLLSDAIADCQALLRQPGEQAAPVMVAHR